MKPDVKKSYFSRRNVVVAIFVCDLFLIALSIYLYVLNNTLNKELSENTSLLREQISKNDSLLNDLAKTQSELRDRTDEVEMLSERVGDITDVVGDLEKLANTDKELLMKYSKVYFLNENYVPSKLDNIDSDLLFNKDKPLLLHAEVIPKLEDMLSDAESDGLDLKVLSAFRSFGTQESLKYNYKITYGAGTANTFSADQGYSEHQLGTTVDLTTSSSGSAFTAFDKTQEYRWLMENAYKYGFVLSYPFANKYYMFEPWHWRFVGVKLAKKLHSDGKFFYDYDQREIDKYLVNIFD